MSMDCQRAKAFHHCMQAMGEDLLSSARAVALGQPLFKRIKHEWSSKQQSEQIAKVLLLQASLPGLMTGDNDAIDLVQQALQGLSSVQVSMCHQLKLFPSAFIVSFCSAIDERSRNYGCAYSVLCHCCT